MHTFRFSLASACLLLTLVAAACSGTSPSSPAGDAGAEVDVALSDAGGDDASRDDASQDDASPDAAVDAAEDAGGDPLPASCTQPALAIEDEDACGPPCSASTTCDGHTYTIECRRGACFSYTCTCKKDGVATATVTPSGDGGFTHACSAEPWTECRF